MNYIDTHCHLTFPQFHSDMEEVIATSFEAGVFRLIVVGTDLMQSQASINLASRYQNIFATVGIHPHDAKNLSSANYLKLETMARDKKVVAIGEIGLDYYRNLSSKEIQKQAFIKQLQLAIKIEKPVVVHCRDAYRELLEVLDNEYVPSLNGRLPGVIHSFSSGVSYLQEFIKRGFYIGFNGMITYPGNEKIIEAVKATPSDRMLIETDAPYLSPQSYRGERNEPIRIIEVAKSVAKIKGVSLEEIASITTSNAVRLFELQ